MKELQLEEKANSIFNIKYISISLFVSILAPLLIYWLNPKNFTVKNFLILFLALFFTMELVSGLLLKFNIFK